MEPLKLLDDLTMEVGVVESQNDELYWSDRHRDPLASSGPSGPLARSIGAASVAAHHPDGMKEAGRRDDAWPPAPGTGGRGSCLPMLVQPVGEDRCPGHEHKERVEEGGPCD